MHIPLCSALVAWTLLAAGDPVPPIQNPYFEHAEWRVWRDDVSAVEGILSVSGKEGAEVEEVLSLEPVAKDLRSYPSEPVDGDEPYAQFIVQTKASKTAAGMWDDVYASWSGLHGSVRKNWRGADGSLVTVGDQIIRFVDKTKQNTLKAGVNFIHQSTTGMAHTITNGYSLPMSTSYERMYFADCLVTSPSHNSFMDTKPEGSTDLYIAHVPTLFNSVGSSNSETMAITKMIIVGAYLPPDTKLLLKRNGLYPAALLSIWKAALPYDEPYAHELRHRVSYKSVGNRETYPEKYSAAGINKGDQALAFHQYDDLQHMRNMIDMARSMDVALPEAVFSVTNVGAGKLHYALKKAAVILQEEGQDIEIRVSTSGCYDLQDLPISTRWKLLYGNKEATIEPDPDDPARVTIRVPWDENLPEGRTAIALIANNGRFDSNPAILTIYRKKSDLPPVGQTPADYKFPATFQNKRPIFLDLQAQTVRPGKQLRVPLRAIDPEGFGLEFFKRAGTIGEIDGDEFVWDCPRKQDEGPIAITLITSDGTSGNSYGGGELVVHVGKKVPLARITADKLTGAAPLTVHFSALDSPERTTKTDFGWSVSEANSPVPEAAFETLLQEKKIEHTFAEPGLYTVELRMRGKAEGKTQVQVWVTEEAEPTRGGDLRVEGGGVYIADGSLVANAFDRTLFEPTTIGASRESTFRLLNPSTENIKVSGRRAVRVEGPDAKAFQVIRDPRRTLHARGSTSFRIRFRPKRAGAHTAQILVGEPPSQVTFTIGGVGLNK